MIKIKKLLDSVLVATSENKVDKILYEFGLQKDKNWKLFGDNPANYNIIDNQQPDPITALAEKPINSIDAILLLECKKRGIKPKSEKAPSSMIDAMKTFFDIDLNKFQDLKVKERRNLSRNIFIISEGSRKEPCLKIVDRGEGQNPEDFSKTFLNQQSTLKNLIPFVQGQYSMGGTGVLRFCGDSAYQLILSKKYPKLLKKGQKDSWGFTLIRRHDTSGTGTKFKAEWYEYLVDNNSKIFNIDSKSLNLVKNEPSFDYGTCIKVYNYTLGPGLRSNITLNLWRSLNRRLFLPIIPITLYEKRQYGGHSPKKILLGNKHRILIDDRNKLEVDPFTIRVDFEDSLGFRDLWIAVFKENIIKTEFTTYSEAIFLTVNGQTMGTLPRSILSSDAGLPYLKDYMLVQIDCSGLDTHTRRKIFMPSRERMADSDKANKLKDKIVYELKHSQKLSDLNEKRKEQRIQDSTKEEEDYLEKVLQKIISSNPSIKNILPFGSKVSTPGKSKPRKNVYYKGKYFPTFLKLYNCKENKTVVKQLPINSYINVKLETDAMNNYLDREKESGNIIFQSNARLLSRGALNNGILNIRIGPNKNSIFGTKEEVTVKLTRPYDSNLETSFLVEFAEPMKNKTVKNKNIKNKKSQDEFDIPKPITIYRDAWKKHGRDWTGEDIVSVFPSVIRGKNSLDVEINMDSNVLINYLRNRPRISESRQDNIKRFYKTSVLLSSVFLYHQLKQERKIDCEEWVSRIIKFMIPIILSLGDKEVSKIIEA